MVRKLLIPMNFVGLVLLVLVGRPIVSDAKVSLSPSPTVTPIGSGGGKILFNVARNQRVEVVEIELDGREQLIFSDNNFSFPAAIWSPDGKYIVFSANRGDSRAGGVGNLYMINTDGSNLKRLTQGPGSSPSWSPDGKQIAYVSDSGINVLQVKGNTTQRIAKQGGYAEPSLLWSPDGEYVGFISATMNLQDEIYLVGMTQNTVETITDNKAAIHGFAWSPDSKKLVYSSDRPQNEEHLYVVDIANKSEARLTDENTSDRMPAWSPDGKYIAYVALAYPKSSLCLIEPDQANRICFTDADSMNLAPAWSLDSQYLAFVSNRDGNYNI